MMPSSDWLPAQPTNPVRPPWTNRPPNHHFTESAGRITKPSSTVTAKPAQAMAAWRNFLASSRYGMKMSGTSLMPAATPVPNPFHQRLLSRVRLAQVPDDQRHQDQVDLAEVHSPQHRLGPEDDARAEQRGAEPDHLVPAVAEAAEREPQRRQQRDDVDGQGQLLGRQPGHERDGRERDGRERGVGERQVELAVSHPVIQRRRQVRVVQRRDVPDDEPARPVYGQVNRVEGVVFRVDDHVDHVAAEGHGERSRAREKQPDRLASWLPRPALAGG